MTPVIGINRIELDDHCSQTYDTKAIRFLNGTDKVKTSLIAATKNKSDFKNVYAYNFYFKATLYFIITKNYIFLFYKKSFNLNLVKFLNTSFTNLFP